MKKGGIIFDLDGTLWDVTDSTYQSANIVVKKHNLEAISKEAICSSFGCNKEECAQIYFPQMDLNQSIELVEEISRINIDNLEQIGGKLYPNLDETLNMLYQEYDLYIVSNTAKLDYIKAFLSTSNTEKYFNDYVAASYLKIPKEDAIRKVINDNNIKKAVYIGDTIKDLNAAQNAGVTFVQSKYGFGEDLKTKYSINSIDELPKVLAILF